MNEKNEKVYVQLNKRNQMQIDFPKSPPTRFFLGVMVHPLKEPRFFHHFHEQVTFNLRPVIPPLFANNSCVSNPVLQKEVFPKSPFVDECSFLVTTNITHMDSLPGYVLAVPGEDKHLTQLINAFSAHSVSIKRFNSLRSDSTNSSVKLSVAQWRLRRMMSRLLKEALRAKLERILVLEDDAIPHRNFHLSMKRLFSDNRCAQCILDNNRGGLLILGTTLWEDGWSLLSKLSRNETGLCRNICTKEIGSFAVVYHKASFKSILSWLSTNTNDPYERFFLI